MKHLLNTAAAAILAIAATGSAMAQGKGETVVFQDYPGTGNMLMRVAKAKGMCEAHGITCELTQIPTSPLGMQALLAGEIQFALAPIEAVNAATLQGANVKVVGGGVMSNILLLAAGPNTETPNAGKPWPQWAEDLRGRTVGVAARGSAVEVYASYLLREAGLDPEKDVTFVATGGVPTTLGALRSGQVDLSFAYDPTGSICVLTDMCELLWRADSAAEPALIARTNGAVVNQATTQAYIDANPHVVDAVIAILKESDAWLNDPANFDEVVQIALSFFKLDMPGGDKIIEHTLRHYVDIHTFNASVDRAAVAAILELSTASGMFPKTATMEQLILDRAP